MKIRKLSSELETSSETVRTSSYVRYLRLQQYEPGMQDDGYECVLQSLVKIYLNIDDDYRSLIN